MKKIKVLFAATECSPFWATGGLGDVVGSLPSYLNAYADMRVILPLYENGIDKKELKKIGVINVPVSWRNQYCGIYTLEKDGIVYYFTENEYYFKRPTIYGQYDDGERFAFFSRAVWEIIRFLDWKPDIVHSNDWQTALVPIYHKLIYKDMHTIKDVFTIHNIEYQGKYDKNILGDLFGLDYNDYHVVDFDGCINLMKGAIETCDALTTVSPTYASQLSEDFYAMGLSNIIKANSHKLTGILNGIDLNSYDPETDKAVFCNFKAGDDNGKSVNKRELQILLNLPVTDAPLIAVVSRLAAHKGMDLIKFALADILKEDVQFVILGKGDQYYEQYFSYMQQTMPGKVCSVIAFNKDLAQKIYAGSDIFLMPSKSEPCGLSQMIACRYGSVPVVRATGGLKDSIVDADKGGNGFLFEKYTVEDFYNAVKRAVDTYGSPVWKDIRFRAMTTDFGWEKSAKKYAKLYGGLI